MQVLDTKTNKQVNLLIDIRKTIGMDSPDFFSFCEVVIKKANIPRLVRKSQVKRYKNLIMASWYYYCFKSLGFNPTQTKFYTLEVKIKKIIRDDEDFKNIETIRQSQKNILPDAESSEEN